MPLFRKEVLEARTGSWLGTIRIGRPLRFSLVTGAAILIVASLITFGAVGQYTRKVSVPGILVPEGGVLDISSPQAARISAILVREGETVQAGQILVRLEADRQLEHGSLSGMRAVSIEQRRTSLQSDLRLARLQAQQQESALQDRLRSLRVDSTSLQGELETMRQRVGLATQTLERFTDLAASGFASPLQTQQKQDELLDLQMRERNARRLIEAAAREQVTAQTELENNRSRLASAQAQNQRDLAALDQETRELEARNAWAITAPRAAIVSALNVAPGQTVQASLTLLSLISSEASDYLPDSSAQASHPRFVAHLYAPSRTAGFVQAGQQVWLRYAAYPHQKFGMYPGKVATVSTTPISPQDLPSGRVQALQQGLATQEPLYRISVVLARQDIQAYGETRALRSGMVLEASIIQDSRSILEWALAPAFSLFRR